MAASLPLCALLSFNSCYPRILRIVLATSCLSACILLLWGATTNNFTIVLEAVLYVFGPVACCVYFYHVISIVVVSKAFPKSLLFILLSCCLLSVWISLEDSLGIANAFASDEQIAIGYGQRLDLTRGRGPFDAPFSAGQWLWFVAVLGAVLTAITPIAPRLVAWTSCGLASIAILNTLSRGPLLLLIISLLMIVVAFLLSNPRKNTPKSLLVIFVVFVAGFLLSTLISSTSYDTAIELLYSIQDPDEASNSIRNERIQSGIEMVEKTFPWGRGVEFWNLKTLVGTGEIYENTWLDYTSSIGALGFLLVLSYHIMLILLICRGVSLWILMKPPRHIYLLFPAFAGLPWTLYGLLFPTLSSRFSCLIAWSLVGASFAFLYPLSQKIRRYNESPV